MTGSTDNRRTWSPELEARLKRMVNDGLSAKDIAQRLHLSRGSVIGKCHRTPGLQLRGEIPSALKAANARRAMSAAHVINKRAPKAPPVPKAAKNAPGASVQTLRALANPSKRAPLVEVVSTPIAQTVTPKDLMHRAKYECAAPVSGNGADTLFCCARTNGTYCTAHMAAFFNAPPDKRLERLARRYA